MKKTPDLRLYGPLARLSSILHTQCRRMPQTRTMVEMHREHTIMMRPTTLQWKPPPNHSSFNLHPRIQAACSSTPLVRSNLHMPFAAIPGLGCTMNSENVNDISFVDASTAEAARQHMIWSLVCTMGRFCATCLCRGCAYSGLDVARKRVHNKGGYATDTVMP